MHLHRNDSGGSLPDLLFFQKLDRSNHKSRHLIRKPSRAYSRRRSCIPSQLSPGWTGSTRARYPLSASGSWFRLASVGVFVSLVQRLNRLQINRVLAFTGDFGRQRAAAACLRRKKPALLEAKRASPQSLVGISGIGEARRCPGRA